METKDDLKRINVQIVGDHGLVWSVPDILKLRTEHRLVGCMVGGIAGFKTQVSVGGLPLKLSPEEVTLALQAGWVQLYHTCFRLPIATTAQQQQQQPAVVEQPCTATYNNQQQQEAASEADTALRDVEQYDEYYAGYYGLPPPTQEQRLQQQQMEQRRRQQRQQQQQRQGPVPAWQAAVASGACFELPMTAQQAAAAAALPVTGVADSMNTDGSSNSSSSGTAGSIQQPVQWSFPHTQQQQPRIAVFADLHSQGYFLTSGSKFGGDFLAYPGDPNLYHAQFVVRVLPLGQVLNPVLFKGLARGVHAARKHLLLASVVQASCGGEGIGGNDEPRQQQQQQQQQQQHQGLKGHNVARGARVVYITVAKEDGFGASK